MMTRLRLPFAVLCGWLMLGSFAFAAEARPNVIVILTDDQGTVDAGCYGSDEIETPALDRLAKTGVRFTQFYAGAPVCSPSRACLLTGRYPVAAGVPGNVSSQKGRKGMPTEQITIAETFRAAGYATAHIGKWHLGYQPATMPNGQGFDVSFGHMGGCIDNYSHFFYWNGPNRHDLWKNGEEIQRPGEFFPDLMLKEATTFIDAQNEKPFLMYFAMNAPHYPYQGEPKWLTKYASLPYPRNLYAAFVSTLDARVGKLLDHLEAKGLRQNTIVVFQSDHGHSCEQRAHFGGGSAGPFRGAKFSHFEGGIRVPAVISWPAKLPQNVTRTQVAHASDWLPTLASLCDVPLLSDAIDGQVLDDVLTDDAATPHDVLHWGSGQHWAVREGKWKLLHNPRDTNLVTVKESPLPRGVMNFLVDLDSDPGERLNVAADHPEIVQRLTKLHREWIASVGK